jgi:hypothetical protein
MVIWSLVAWARRVGAEIRLNPARASAETNADAKTDARRNFFIQCSWEIKKIVIDSSTRKGTICQQLPSGARLLDPRVADIWVLPSMR